MQSAVVFLSLIVGTWGRSYINDQGCQCVCSSTAAPPKNALKREGAQDLTVAAFNVQVFGIRKSSKKDVMTNLKKIFTPWDIALFQEIRDKSNTSIYKFLNDLNDGKTGADATFGMTIGARQGKSASKEQYAYFYRKSRCSVSDAYDYADPGDIFQREPYVVKFHCPDAGVEEFAIIGVHTEPSSAEKEIDALIDVYEDAKERFQTENFLLMGDFNADCSYFNVGERKKSLLKNDPRFKWLLGDEQDSTTKSSNCAYDRFVVAGDSLQAHAKDAHVQRFDLELDLDEKLTIEISDHYPIVLTVAAEA